MTLKTTLGTIKIEMEPDWAPNHVRNFLMLAETGWYNGTAFHRVVKASWRREAWRTSARTTPAPRRPLGSPAQGRVPQRREACTRHRLAWRAPTTPIPPQRLSS